MIENNKKKLNVWHIIMKILCIKNEQQLTKKCIKNACVQNVRDDDDDCALDMAH